jgi:hypothetical protein
VIHRTFRSLDESPKLVFFTIKQWLGLIAGSALVFGLIYLAGLPTKPAISLFVFAVGLPAALTYVSESGGLQIGVLLREMWRWRWSPKTLVAASPKTRAPGLLVLVDKDETSPEGADRPSLVGVDEMTFWERWG